MLAAVVGRYRVEGGPRRDFKPHSLRDRVHEILKRIGAAHTAWITEGETEKEKASRAKSDYLAYIDSAGLVFDFHALRHQFISNLPRGGASPKEAQALARHSTITLTMDRYTHLGIVDLTAALDRLPKLPGNDGPELGSVRFVPLEPTTRASILLYSLLHSVLHFERFHPVQGCL
jgi:integrase